MNEFDDLNQEIEEGLAKAEKMLSRKKFFRIIVAILLILFVSTLLVSGYSYRTASIEKTATYAEYQTETEEIQQKQTSTASALTATSQAVNNIHTVTAQARNVASTATVEAQATIAASTAKAQEAAATSTTMACLDMVTIPVDPSWNRVFCDQYSDNENKWDVGEWASEDVGKTTLEIKKGKYVWSIEPYNPDGSGSAFWLDSIYIVNDFYFSVEAKRVSGSVSNACYGIIFRAHKSDYYSFEACDDHYYYVGFPFEDSWKALINWTGSGNIQTGEVNKLAVIAQKNRFDFFINDEFEKTIENDQFDRGIVGLAADVYDGESAVFEFDNFILISP